MYRNVQKVVFSVVWPICAPVFLVFGTDTKFLKLMIHVHTEWYPGLQNVLEFIAMVDICRVTSENNAESNRTSSRRLWTGNL